MQVFVDKYKEMRYNEVSYDEERHIPLPAHKFGAAFSLKEYNQRGHD